MYNPCCKGTRNSNVKRFGTDILRAYRTSYSVYQLNKGAVVRHEMHEVLKDVSYTRYMRTTLKRDMVVSFCFHSSNHEPGVPK